MSSFPHSWTILLRLAISDLLHERILTLNVILALAAIIAPLLLVLGFKEGIVNHMREDLVQNPVNREIRPKATQDLASEWFSRVAERPDVEFIIPGILRGASTVRVMNDNGDSKAVDLLPSGEGDPLILENDAIPPQAGEIVVSTPLAETMGLTAGDQVRVRVTRTYGGRPQHVDQDMVVRSILGLRGDVLDRIYAPQALVVDVETYREGNGVPTRGWPGAQPIPFASYDGAIVVLKEKLSPIRRRELGIGTGFVGLKNIDAASFAQRFGFPAPEQAELIELRVIGGAAKSSNLRQLANRLRGRDALVVPFVDGLELTTHTGERVPVSGYSISDEQADRFGLARIPWGDAASDAEFSSLAQIVAPPGPGFDAEKRTTVPTSKAELALPINRIGDAPGDVALIPLPLAAMLRTARDRPVVYSDQEATLLLGRPGFRGFRIYAKSIDDVPGIVTDLRDGGVSTIAKVQEILGLQQFSRNMDLVFYLVASVALVGGIAALIASLYASVERKKRDISMMRLLGLSPAHVFRFPVFQGIIVAALGLIAAGTLYWGAASLMNEAFSDSLDGDPAVMLAPSIVAAAAAIILAAAFVSSLFAAYKATRIDPAEAIRVE